MKNSKTLKTMKIRNILIGLSLTVLVFSGCSSDSQKTGKEQIDKQLSKLIVGVHSWPGGGMIYVGDKMGFFKDAGIDLKIKKIENFDTKRASLISGDIDVDIANTMDQLVIYTENDFPAQVIAVSDESVGGDGLVAKSSITDLSQLKGKTVAYAEASPSDFFLRYILSKKGVDISSVKLKPVADPQIAGNAVIAGQVDAAVTYEPWLSQAEDTEGLSMLASTKDYPTLIPGLIIANGEKIALEKAMYVSFLSAWFKSVEYYNSNREESYKMIAEGMGMDLVDVKDILSVVDIQDLESNKAHFDKEKEDNLYDLVKGISIFWIENGFVTKPTDSEKTINKSLLQEL